MKLSTTTVAWLVLMLLAPVILVSQVRPYFSWSFDRYQVYASFQRPDAAPAYFDQVLDFIRPPFNTYLDNRWFSTEDVLHMQDVQQLFIAIYALAITSLVIAALGTFNVDRGKLARLLRKLWGMFLIFVAGLSLIGAFFWAEAFDLFHRLLFGGNSYWQLDPRTSNLIKYLPEQIFQELLLALLILWLVEWLLVYLAAKNTPGEVVLA